MLIPIKALLLRTGEGPVAVIVFVDVDESVTFLHLTGRGTDQVDWAPTRIAENLDAVLDGLMHLFDMFRHIVDAIVVLDVAVHVWRVDGTESILNDEQRFLIAVVQLVRRDTEASRVDRPTPFRLLEERVLERAEDVAFGRCVDLRVRARRPARIIAEADIVDGVLFQQLEVAIFHLERDAVFVEETFGIARVFTARLHIDEEERFTVLVHRVQDVVRVARVGVRLTGREHAADLHVGIDGVRRLDRFRARDELMMRRLVFHLLLVLVVLEHETGADEWQVQQHIDLIERHPIFHLAVIAGEQRRRVRLEEVDDTAVAPTAVVLDEADRHVEVGDRDDRLDPVLQQFVEDAVIKLQSGLVRLGVVAVREDAGP